MENKPFNLQLHDALGELSVSEAARRTGLERRMLGKILYGQHSPLLRTCVTLARGLHRVPVTFYDPEGHPYSFLSEHPFTDPSVRLYIGRTFSCERKKHGFNQRDFAVHVGLYFDTYRRYETGYRGMRIYTLELVSHALGLVPVYLQPLA